MQQRGQHYWGLHHVSVLPPLTPFPFRFLWRSYLRLEAMPVLFRAVFTLSQLSPAARNRLPPRAGHSHGSRNRSLTGDIGVLAPLVNLTRV